MKVKKKSVDFLGWDGIFFRKRSQTGHRSHDASTTSSARLWLIQNMLITHVNGNNPAAAVHLKALNGSCKSATVVERRRKKKCSNDFLSHKNDKYE